MKRLPIVLTLIALVALAASIAYWVLQLYKPPQRPLAAAPIVAAPEPAIDAAATLFGGQAATAVAANFQLTGVVSAGPDSVVIISDGGPPKAVRIGREVAPGVLVSEVHARYVMLSDGGVMKRIDLPADTRSAPEPGAAGVAPPAPGPVGAVPAGEPSLAPGAVQTPPPEVPEPGRPNIRPDDEAEPEPPPNPAVPAPAPGGMPAQPGMQPTQPGMQPAAPGAMPVAPPQMPAPVRSPASPVGGPAPSAR